MPNLEDFNLTNPTAANKLGDTSVLHTTQHGTLNDHVAELADLLRDLQKGVAKASLRSTDVAAGDLARVTDDVRGLWMRTSSQWFSLSGEAVNVKEFGAVGDGVTVDTTAIQAAIDAVNAGGGGVVWFPPGTYLSGNLVVKTGVHLRGSWAAILKDNGGALDHFIGADGATDCSVADLQVDGNADAQTTSHIGIYMRGQRIQVHNCYVHDTSGAGIQVGKPTSGSSEDMFFTNNYVRDVGHSTTGTNRFGIAGTSCDRLLIANNIVERVADRATTSMQAGIGVEPNSGQTIDNMTVDGNLIKGCRMHLSNGSGTSKNVVVTGNYVNADGNTGAGTAIFVGASGTVVSGNKFKGPTSGNGCMELGGTGSVVTGNIFEDWTTTQPGINMLNTQKALVGDNVFRATSGTISKGIEENGTADENLILFNIFDGITTPVSTSGSGSRWFRVSSGHLVWDKRVGIGTSSPGINLHVRDDLAGGFSGIYLENRATNAGSRSGIRLGTNSAGDSRWFLSREGATTGDLELHHSDFTSGQLFARWRPNGAFVTRAAQTFTDLDTTPSVDGANIFKCSNSAATTITAFDDHVNGQEFTVVFTNGNTTVQNGANLKLHGGANFTPAADTVLSFVSDGTTVWELPQRTNLPMVDGGNITVGTTTGTKIGTSTSQKLGFFNATPVVKPSALTAADAATVDAIYGAEEQGVINNLRTRLNELETRLQNLGLLT